MATHGILYIKSNDGTADAGTLAIYDASGASLITVTATGATSDFSGADAYTYGGNKEFLGFAEVANATEPTYAIGDTFYASGRGTVYIVEAELTTSGVTVEYNGSVVATVEGGNTATLPVKDKKMATDIVVTVPEAEGEVIPEYTEAEDFTVFVESEDEGELTIGYSVSQDVKLPNGVHRLGVIAYEGEEPNLISKTITENGTYKASEEVQDELAGTWLLNQSISGWSGETTEFIINGKLNSYDGNNNYVEGATITSLSLSQTNATTFLQINSDLIYENSDLGFPVKYPVYNYYYRNYGIYSGYISIENGNGKTVSPTSAEGLLLRTFTINSKLSEVANGDLLLAWLKANATKQPASAIEGYSEVVVNVEATDSPLPIEVSTEAEMTALLTSGEVGGVYKYTGTTGTYENGALYVLESDLITFTIDGTSYQAEDGMTWEQWVASDYNTGDYRLNGIWINKGGNGSSYVANSSGTFATTSDTIISGHSYSMQSSGEPA